MRSQGVEKGLPMLTESEFLSINYAYRIYFPRIELKGAENRIVNSKRSRVLKLFELIDFVDERTELGCLRLIGTSIFLSILIQEVVSRLNCQGKKK